MRFFARISALVLLAAVLVPGMASAFDAGRADDGRVYCPLQRRWVERGGEHQTTQRLGDFCAGSDLKAKFINAVARSSGGANFSADAFLDYAKTGRIESSGGGQHTGNTFSSHSAPAVGGSNFIKDAASRTAPFFLRSPDRTRTRAKAARIQHQAQPAKARPDLSTATLRGPPLS